MEIKVSELPPGPQTDALVAEARGWKYMEVFIDGPNWGCGEGNGWILCKDYNPSGNGGQAMELVKSFEIDVLFKTSMTWEAVLVATNKFGEDECVTQYGETPEIAICKAVIASRFGETVEVEE